jgi:hypothetical protein
VTNTYWTWSGSELFLKPGLLGYSLSCPPPPPFVGPAYDATGHVSETGVQLVAPYKQLRSISRTTVRGGWQYLNVCAMRCIDEKPAAVGLFLLRLDRERYVFFAVSFVLRTWLLLSFLPFNWRVFFLFRVCWRECKDFLKRTLPFKPPFAVRRCFGHVVECDRRYYYVVASCAHVNPFVCGSPSFQSRVNAVCSNVVWVLLILLFIKIYVFYHVYYIRTRLTLLNL